jgi:hypothetical protein
LASQINASNSGFGGIVSTGDSSGVLQLQTVGTTAITVDTSQNTTLAGKLTTASSGVQFSDGSTQTAAASPYGLKNRIINGDMVIDQRNAGASVSNANGFITDRWSLSKYDPTGGSYSGQQVSDAPTGFKNSLKVTVTSSITQSADQYWQAFQIIEGYNIADLGFGTSSPSQITVSFWVKSSVTGTYSIAFYNEGVGSVTRAYVTTYVINTANTWEQKSVTITGDGASGAGYWGSTNNAGLGLYFDLGCGTNQQATANTWASGNVRRVSGTIRLMNTSSATWQITGVQLERNTTATPFEWLPYGTELALCQRYFQVIVSGSGYFSNASAQTSTNAFGMYTLPVTMRTAPTGSVVTGTNYYRFLANDTDDFVDSVYVNGQSTNNVIIGNSTQISNTQGRPGVFTAQNAASFVAAQAEL